MVYDLVEVDVVLRCAKLRGCPVRGRLQANLGNSGDIHLPFLATYKSTTLHNCVHKKLITLT